MTITISCTVARAEASFLELCKKYCGGDCSKENHCFSLLREHLLLPIGSNQHHGLINANYEHEVSLCVSRRNLCYLRLSGGPGSLV
jgi:hypothetical protein